MESRKDIGQAFREKLDQLQKQPGDAVWDSIRSDLNKGRKKAVPVWLRFWLLTGVFLVAGFFTYPLWENKVPHIYIKMPEQENEEVQGATTKEGTSKVNYNTGTDATNDAVTITNADKPYQEENTLDNDPGTTSGAVINPTVTTVEKTASPASKGFKRAETAGEIENEINVREKSEYSRINRTTVGQTGKASVIKSSEGITTTTTTKKNNPAALSGSVASNASVRTNKNSGNQNNNTPGDRTAKPNTGVAITDTGKSVKKSTSTRKIEDEDEDTGFIVPATPDYKNYRNNIGNGFVVADVEQDSADYSRDKDSVSISDKLKIRTTGVEQAIKAPETKPQTESQKNFFIYAFAAPLKYSFEENGSYLSSWTNNSATSSKTDLAYGASIGYRANDQLSIRAGVIFSNAEVQTDNVSVRNSYNDTGVVIPSHFDNVQYENGISNENVRNQLATGLDENNQNTALVNVRTELSFIEVPFEVTYGIFSSGNFRIGIRGIAGARFLNDNKVYAQNTQGSVVLGKLKNVEDVSFSAGLGTSFSYEFVPSLQLNVEPSLRYYSGNKDLIKPTVWMIQAGLQFNFDLFKKK